MFCFSSDLLCDCLGVLDSAGLLLPVVICLKVHASPFLQIPAAKNLHVLLPCSEFLASVSVMLSISFLALLTFISSPVMMTLFSFLGIETLTL